MGTSACVYKQHNPGGDLIKCQAACTFALSLASVDNLGSHALAGETDCVKGVDLLQNA